MFFKDQNEAVLDQSTRLLSYLSAVAREIGPEPKRDVRDQEATLWPDSVPSHTAVTVGTSEIGAAWITVKKVPEPAPPVVPNPLRKLIDPFSIRDPDAMPRFSAPQILEHIDKIVSGKVSVWLQEIERELQVPDENGQDSDNNFQSNSNRIHSSQRDSDHENRVGYEIAKRKAVLSTQLRATLDEELNRWIASAWSEWAMRVKPAFEARRLYSRLFELHLQLESDTATLEAMWGHCIFSQITPSGKVINAPLLTTPIEFKLDENNGTISVLPVRLPQLELDALEGSEIPGIEGLQRIQRRIAQDPVDLWSPTDRRDLREQLIVPLGIEARLDPSENSISPSRTPVLNDGWVLYIRKRPLRQEAFYESLSEHIQAEGVVPEALASIVTDNDSVDRAVIASGRELESNDNSAKRMLMPLPTNDEQERIARQLASSRGVTVQGPPGTGKSHTIVNLLSHLVAQGKRVLITAQNEQALSVIREKIPEEIRDFSIAALGSTPTALEELRISAQSMRGSLSSVNISVDSKRLVELGNDIDMLREEARRVDLDLVEALRSEQREFSLPSGNARASEVAIWLAKSRHLDYIPDRVPADNKFPLTLKELSDFQTLAREIKPEDVKRILQGLPEDDWVPSASHLKELWEELDRLAIHIKTSNEEGLRLEQLDTYPDEKLRMLVTELYTGADELAQHQGEWETRLAEQLRLRTTTSEWVMKQNADLTPKLDELEVIYQSLLGQDVEVPDQDPNVIIPLLETWKLRLEQGKKIPIFGNKDLKELSAHVKVSGYPVTKPEQIRTVVSKVQLLKVQRELYRAMGDAYRPFSISVPEIGDEFLFSAKEIYARVNRIGDWWREIYPRLREQLNELISSPDPASTSEGMKKSADLLNGVTRYRQHQALQSQVVTLESRIEKSFRESVRNVLWAELRQAFQNRDVSKWSETVDEINRLVRVRRQYDELLRLQDRLSSAGAKKWARAIVSSRADDDVIGEISSAHDAWVTAQARTWLDDLHAGNNVDALMEKSHVLSQELQDNIIGYASLSARLKLKENMKDPQRRALETWLTAIRRVGKGTGKNAAKFQAQAREALPAAMGAVPVWIMPIYRVLENFDPRQSDLFDVVIVDESSQCDLLSLGVLALGKKSVVVGDDKQISPAAVGIDTSRIFDLQNQYLTGFKDRTLLTLDESLYAISARAFPSTILLKEHFRCVPEIIGFSSRFYGNRILPLREKTAHGIGDPLQVVHVPDGVSIRKGSQRVNTKEAEALVDQVVECTENPEYDGLTFGVVTMMSGPQANLIESMLMDRLGIDEFEQRRLRVGTPPKFQGDERNVVFLSYVADDNSFAATRESHAQWANVAASRAQDQLWLFHSMDPSTLNANDYRRALLEYALDEREAIEPTDLMALTESKFESDVLMELLQRGYKVTPQYRVGGYRIDMVVTLGEGERLAIECDGDSFHGPEQWEQDVRRQRVLERLGWSFWRVRASAFYLDAEEALASLWVRLDESKERVRNRKLARAQQEANRAAARRAKEAERIAHEETELQPVQHEPFESENESLLSVSQDSGLQTGEQESFSLRLPIKLSARVVEKTPPPVSNNEFVGENVKESDSIDTQHIQEQLDTGMPRNAPFLDEVGTRQLLKSLDTGDETHGYPSQLEMNAAWSSGIRYRLRSGGELLRVGSEVTLEEVVGTETAKAVVERIKRIRESGIFKVSNTGVMVTLLDGELTFVGYFDLNNLRF